MTLNEALANSELIPNGFVAIGPADHPTKPHCSGMLARNRATGIYVLLAGGASVSVPHRWAQEAAHGMGKGSDAIQDLCIARMTELGLNPNQVAERLDGQVSRTHVCDYLTRRASIGSHKLQHLLVVLQLAITSSPG